MISFLLLLTMLREIRCFSKILSIKISILFELDANQTQCLPSNRRPQSILNRELLMKKILIITIVVIQFLIFSICHGQNEKFASATIIINVNIVDAVSDRIIPNQSIRIEKGKIVEIAKSEFLRKLPGDQLVDGQGKFLMPGITDMHVHLDKSSDDLTLYLNYGVTTIRSLDGTLEHLKWRNAINAGTLDGPTVFTSSPILYGAGGDFDGEFWKATPDTNQAAEKIVANLYKSGYDAIKVYYQLSSDEYDALVKAADQVNLPIVGHVPWSKTITEILEAGQTTNEHMSGFDTEMLLPNSKYANIRTGWGNMLRFQDIDDQKMQKYINNMQHYKHWITPTAIIYEMFTRPAFVNNMLANEKMMGVLTPEMRKNWASFNRWQIPDIKAQTDQEKKLMFSAIQKRRQWIKAFHDAGVGIALGTDGGGRWTYPGLSSLQELEIYVLAGLTPAEAIKTATVNAAAALNQENVFGEVKEGFRADLLLLDGNPLKDIKATQKILGVMARGKWFSKKALDSKLDALYKKRINENKLTETGQLGSK